MKLVAVREAAVVFITLYGLYVQKEALVKPNYGRHIGFILINVMGGTEETGL